jgi:hypothetical protein
VAESPKLEFALLGPLEVRDGFERLGRAPAKPALAALQPDIKRPGRRVGNMSGEA